VATAVVGRARAAAPLLTAGDLVMDRRDRAVTRAGRPVHLSPRAYRLLEVLLEHRGTVVSRERLFATVWGGEQLSNVLHAYVRFLRAGLEAGGEPRVLHTVRGIGYRLDPGPR
jgi:two-component system response regulator MprA